MENSTEAQILAELNRIRENQMIIDKRLSLHIQETIFELKHIAALDDQQNKLIDQHIEGVKSVKDLILAHEKTFDQRIKAVEEPIKTIVTLRKWIVSLAGLLAAIGVIYTFLDKF